MSRRLVWSGFALLLVLSLLVLARIPAMQRRWVAVAVEAVERPGREVLVVVAGADSRDGAEVGDRRYVATSAGLAVHDLEGRRLDTWGRGQGITGELLAVAPWGDGRVVAATSGGMLAVVERGRLSLRRVPWTLTDLAVVGSSVWLATAADGVWRWDGRGQASQLAGLADEPVTALAVSPGGRLAVGSARGPVWVVGGGESERVAGGDEPVTALAWEGGRLWVGRPGALDVIEAGVLRRVRTDLSVVSLAAEDGVVHVAPMTGGVLTLSDAGERARLGSERVLRLRAIDGAVIAFGDGGGWNVETGERWSDAPPPGLSAPRVAALAVLGDELWVGTERGIDVLSADGVRLRHLALPAVRALAEHGGEMLVATGGGAHRVDARGRLSRADVYGADARDVSAFAGRVAWATDAGVTVTRPGASLARLPLAGVRSVAWGPGGGLWVGTDQGVGVLDEDLAWTSAPAPPVSLGRPEPLGDSMVYPTGDGVVRWRRGALALPQVRALAVVRARLIVGTGDGRLAIGEGDGWRPLATHISLPQVTTLAASDEHLWVGTTGGLVRLPLAPILVPLVL